jgi:uncharacterized protein (DUF952 family)
MTDLLHITERTAWESARQAGEYRLSTRHRTLEEEGFVHCSLRHQLRTVAEFLYGDADDLVVLVIDSTRLPAPLRYESTDGTSEIFPHVYGPIPVEAVSDVIAVTRDDTGRLVLPE